MTTTSSHSGVPEASYTSTIHFPSEGCTICGCHTSRWEEALRSSSANTPSDTPSTSFCARRCTWRSKSARMLTDMMTFVPARRPSRRPSRPPPRPPRPSNRAVLPSRPASRPERLSNRDVSLPSRRTVSSRMVSRSIFPISTAVTNPTASRMTSCFSISNVVRLSPWKVMAMRAEGDLSLQFCPANPGGHEQKHAPDVSLLPPFLQLTAQQGSRQFREAHATRIRQFG
mmetsp:Transcript_66315/g.158210  ORF Transcript_66315/g.158210 Transcript_66315/m.158210 type:complete len:228 (+) Transcript_66315:56-739(+)